MSSTCSVKDDGQGEYPQCQQCWKLHDEDPSLVFQNSADFRGSVVLFHFKTLAEERRYAGSLVQFMHLPTILINRINQIHAIFSPQLVPQALQYVMLLLGVDG